MYLESIFYGISFFLIVLVIHIAIWRLIKPKKHMSSIFAIFLVIPFIIFIGLFVLSIQEKLFNFTELLKTSLLYLVLACAYIQTYPPAQANAPSLQIIHLIGKSKSKGLTEEEIMNIFNLNNLVQDRIDDLIVEGFVLEEDGKLYLKNKGKILSTTFYFYRKLYGLSQGEG